MQRSFACTNDTRLPEVLKAWPVELFMRILPRHLRESARGLSPEDSSSLRLVLHGMAWMQTDR